MSEKRNYSPLQIGLHWATATLIVANYVISDGMPQAFDAHLQGQALTGLTPTFHVWAGSLLLALVIMRLVVRLVQGAPKTEESGWMARVAALGHWALYGLMLAVPAFGAIAWFGKTELTSNLHVITMNAMMLLILGHAAMAIFHQYVLKDGLLGRMIPLR